MPNYRMQWTAAWHRLLQNGYRWPAAADADRSANGPGALFEFYAFFVAKQSSSLGVFCRRERREHKAAATRAFRGSGGVRMNAEDRGSC
jgi:hypothetical protein